MVVKEQAWGLGGSFQDTVAPRPSQSSADALSCLEMLVRGGRAAGTVIGWLLEPPLASKGFRYIHCFVLTLMDAAPGAEPRCGPA